MVRIKYNKKNVDKKFALFYNFNVIYFACFLAIGVLLL